MPPGAPDDDHFEYEGNIIRFTTILDPIQATEGSFDGPDDDKSIDRENGIELMRQEIRQLMHRNACLEELRVRASDENSNGTSVSTQNSPSASPRAALHDVSEGAPSAVPGAAPSTSAPAPRVGIARRLEVSPAGSLIKLIRQTTCNFQVNCATRQPVTSCDRTPRHSTPPSC